MSLCFIINSFSNKTIDAMGAAVLPNLLRLSMLKKPDVTSVVSQTVFVSLMSHLRFCRRRKSQLRLCRVNKPNKMDDSDSDDELIICTFHLMTTIVYQKHKLNERGQKRKIWERDWICLLYTSPSPRD